MRVSKSELRASIRAARRALSAGVQEQAALQVASRLEGWLAGRAIGTAAAYLAADGELSPAGPVAQLRMLGWQIAYPRIANDAMTFHLVGNDEQLVPGRWGLTEPAADAPVVAAAALDVVLTPLVAFDPGCNRMGRGKAYYDRAFAFLAESVRPGRPAMVGLAHDLQQIEAIPLTPHDIAMDAVVTPGALFGRLPSG